MRTHHLTRILTLLALVAIVPLTVSVVSPIKIVRAVPPVLVENFKNNTFNSTMWKIVQDGTGPTAVVVNERLQVTLPSNSSNNPSTGAFTAGLSSLCNVHGDFDMRVNFQLKVWPPTNGVRVGLSLQGSGATERISESTSGEIYLTNFLDGIQGITSARDVSGFLRMSRTGGTATGYYLNGTSWTVIHSGPVTSSDALFVFAAWSHDNAFAHQTVEMTFGNFTMTTGQIACATVPRVSITPNGGLIGTLVTVKGSGLPIYQSYYPIVQTVTVSFDDMFLGIAEEHAGSFTFTLDVPLSQPGAHLIKAVDYLTDTYLSTNFQVMSQPSALAVHLVVGTIYFPHDTVVAMILVTSSDLPVSSSSLQVNLTLTRPDDSHLVLPVTSLGNGLFRSSYALPVTAPLGTYSLTAVGQLLGGAGGSTVGTFEVKLPWLSAQGQTVAVAGLASVAALGIGLVGFITWRKLHFKKSPEGSP